jgi:hypothetical protein
VCDLPATQITADHLLAWKQALCDANMGEVTAYHALGAVKSCWY